MKRIDVVKKGNEWVGEDEDDDIVFRAPTKEDNPASVTIDGQVYEITEVEDIPWT